MAVRDWAIDELGRRAADEVTAAADELDAMVERDVRDRRDEGEPPAA